RDQPACRPRARRAPHGRDLGRSRLQLARLSPARRNVAPNHLAIARPAYEDLHANDKGITIYEVETLLSTDFPDTSIGTPAIHQHDGRDAVTQGYEGGLSQNRDSFCSCVGAGLRMEAHAIVFHRDAEPRCATFFRKQSPLSLSDYWLGPRAKQS